MYFLGWIVTNNISLVTCENSANLEHMIHQNHYDLLIADKCVCEVTLKEQKIAILIKVHEQCASLPILFLSTLSNEYLKQQFPCEVYNFITILDQQDYEAYIAYIKTAYLEWQTNRSNK